MVVARDGAETLDYLLATGRYEGRDLRAAPQVILPDLALPKADGLEVLGCIRGEAPARGDPHLFGGRRTSRPRRGGQQPRRVRKPVGVGRFREAGVEPGMHRVLSNEASAPR